MSFFFVFSLLFLPFLVFPFSFSAFLSPFLFMFLLYVPFPFPVSFPVIFPFFSVTFALFYPLFSFPFLLVFLFVFPYPLFFSFLFHLLFFLFIKVPLPCHFLLCFQSVTLFFSPSLFLSHQPTTTDTYLQRQVLPHSLKLHSPFPSDRPNSFSSRELRRAGTCAPCSLHPWGLNKQKTVLYA